MNRFSDLLPAIHIGLLLSSMLHPPFPAFSSTVTSPVVILCDKLLIYILIKHLTLQQAELAIS